MGYTAFKGGADAIAAAQRLITALPVDSDERLLELRQVAHQLGAAVDTVMGEGGLYAPELAALAIVQCEGDLFEASFMLRAYRSTLPRFTYAMAVTGDAMRVRRRVSSAFKDIPGGQVLGRTRDYTQRLLDLERLEARPTLPAAPVAESLPSTAMVIATGETRPNGAGQHDQPNGHTNGHAVAAPSSFPKVSNVLRAAGVTERLPATETKEPFDITRDAPRFPVSRPAWLQALARGESGAMVCLAYSSIRGYGGVVDHGTIGELRTGSLPLRVAHPVTGQAVTVGWYRATEVEMLGPQKRRRNGEPGAPNLSLSYGLVFGQNERKAISMAILDSTLQAAAPVDGQPAPANDQEMVLMHIDGIESFGFVEHLKLPHYVDFSSTLRTIFAEAAPASSIDAAPAEPDHHHHHDAPEADADHTGLPKGALHHHGDGVLHAHDED